MYPMNESTGNVHFNEFLGKNMWLYYAKCGIKRKKISHMQNCLNPQNEDTNVTKEQVLHLHSYS